jgi:hypothetical protein
MRQDHGIAIGETILETDDWDDVLAVIEQERSK